MIVKTNGKLGSETTMHSGDDSVTTTLWGFNRHRSQLVVEVSINKTSIGKVSIKKNGDQYQHLDNPNFNYGYKHKLLTGTQHI